MSIGRLGAAVGLDAPDACRGVIRGGAAILREVRCAIFGDEPAYDGLLERFPQNYHEPYYPSYVNEDFPAMARQCGLTHRRDVTTFVSMVVR